MNLTVSQFTRRIRVVNWIIQAIGKHIVAEDALASTGVGVGIDESAQFWIVISTLEIIEAGFSIVVVAAVAQGVDFCDVRIIAVAMVRSFNNLTVGVVFVAGLHISVKPSFSKIGDRGFRESVGYT